MDVRTIRASTIDPEGFAPFGRVLGTDDWAQWMSPSHPETPDAPAFDMSITVGWNTAKAAGLTRADCDAWAVRSHHRAIAAIDEGRFTDEIAPITTKMKVVDALCEFNAGNLGTEIEKMNGGRAVISDAVNGVSATEVRNLVNAAAGIDLQRGDAVSVDHHRAAPVGDGEHHDVGEVIFARRIVVADPFEQRPQVGRAHRGHRRNAW